MENQGKISTEFGIFLFWLFTEKALSMRHVGVEDLWYLIF